jgi:cytochrome P450
MRTLGDAVGLTDRPAQLATAAPVARWHAALRAAGTFRCGDGSWVVAGPSAVRTALAAPELSVAAPEFSVAAPEFSVAPGAQQIQDGPTTRLVALMARFSDAPDHQRRRALVARLMPSVAEVSRAAGALADDYLRRRSAPFDVMPMARSAPVQALARALGLPAGPASQAATLTGKLCDALAPSLTPRSGTGTVADAVATELTTLMAGLGSGDEEEVAALISILFQARDATAALIGTAMLAVTGPLDAGSAAAGRLVERVLRQDAPVQCTRRIAKADLAIGDSEIPAGAAVWIFLATAEWAGGTPATFGSGPHACPGAAQATAIARQAVAVLAAEGWRALPGQHVSLEPRPNIRVPARVLVARS